MNNWTEDEFIKIQAIECVYIVVGKEVGEQGTPHLQGYIYFAKRGIRMGGVKALPGLERAHLEKAGGTAEQNRAYCTKQGNYYESGQMPRPGSRGDIAGVREIIKNTGSMRAVVEAATSYQSMRAGELMLKYVKAPGRPFIKVRWFWGPTGTGKTFSAMAEAGDDYWMSSRGLKWFDGYDGEKNVIIDDYRIGFCAFEDLLRILDKAPYRVEIKGGSRPFHASNIWITAPHPPTIMWEGRTDEDLNQLLRRIHEIRSFHAVPLGVPEVQGVILGPEGAAPGPHPQLHEDEKKE